MSQFDSNADRINRDVADRKMLRDIHKRVIDIGERLDRLEMEVLRPNQPTRSGFDAEDYRG